MLKNFIDKQKELEKYAMLVVENLEIRNFLYLIRELCNINVTALKHLC